MARSAKAVKPAVLTPEEWQEVLDLYYKNDPRGRILNNLHASQNFPVLVDGWIYGGEFKVREIAVEFKRSKLPFKLHNTWDKAPRATRKYFTQIIRLPKTKP